MEKITKPSSLKQGDKIVKIVGSVHKYYEYLMPHPHNENYVLLLDILTMDAVKVYIPQLTEEHSHYYINFTYEELRLDLIDYYERQIKKLKERHYD